MADLARLVADYERLLEKRAQEAEREHREFREALNRALQEVMDRRG